MLQIYMVMRVTLVSSSYSQEEKYLEAGLCCQFYDPLKWSLPYF